MSEYKEEFINYLDSVTSMDWEYVEYHDWWGKAGSSLSGIQRLNCHVDEIFKRYPEATMTDIRRGSMIAMKRQQKRKREELWQEELKQLKAEKPCNLWQYLCRFFFYG